MSEQQMLQSFQQQQQQKQQKQATGAPAQQQQQSSKKEEEGTSGGSGSSTGEGGEDEMALWKSIIASLPADQQEQALRRIRASTLALKSAQEQTRQLAADRNKLTARHAAIETHRVRAALGIRCDIACPWATTTSSSGYHACVCAPAAVLVDNPIFTEDVSRIVMQYLVPAPAPQ